jgi:septum formation protein
MSSPHTTAPNAGGRAQASHPGHARPLILASTSRYRLELLRRLKLDFAVQPPEVDETPRTDESPQSLALRLAHAKAWAVARLHPTAVVIGSDQVLDLDGEPVGKPHTHERAVAQLLRMSGKRMVFHTAVCVVCDESGFEQTLNVPTVTEFRNLSADEIERYLLSEAPYDCAGSAKSEGLGIALLRSMQSDDPTAIVGLPLISVAQMLRDAGLGVV